MTLLLALLLAAAPPPTIVDTDAGSDDLLAISYLLSRPDVHIDAITVVSGLAHVNPGAANIERLLHIAGRAGIPVYIGPDATPPGGHDFPAAWRTAADGILGSHPATKMTSASEYLKARLRSPCRILALGPLTNIAAALAAGNAVTGIVIMGGAVRVPGNVDSEPAAEWNIYADPRAAKKVFSSGLPITLIPLDATNMVPIGADFIERFHRSAATALGKAAAGILTKSPPEYAWDPLAAVAFTNPEVIVTAPVSIEITGSGRTREAPGKPANVQVAFRANPALFKSIFVIQ
jgi:pyrimidine-specific ribonucleoside hydrolase